MMKKAHQLAVGDVFRLHVHGEVLAAASFANGKRVKVRLHLENQGRRDNRGLVGHPPKGDELEFTDSGCVLEFICRASRTFQLHEWDEDGGNSGQAEKRPNPSPEHAL